MSTRQEQLLNHSTARPAPRLPILFGSLRRSRRLHTSDRFDGRGSIKPCRRIGLRNVQTTSPPQAFTLNMGCHRLALPAAFTPRAWLTRAAGTPRPASPQPPRSARGVPASGPASRCHPKPLPPLRSPRLLAKNFRYAAPSRAWVPSQGTSPRASASPLRENSWRKRGALRSGWWWLGRRGAGRAARDGGRHA